MRRFVITAIAVGALSVPAQAGAHTLSIADARAEVARWAQTVASTSRSYAWGVGECRQLNQHVVECDYWTDSQAAGGNDPTTIHCDAVMQVRIVGTSFYHEFGFPVNSCGVRGP